MVIELKNEVTDIRNSIISGKDKYGFTMMKCVTVVNM